MASFTQIKSIMVPLPHANVDTDQIIPARYLKVIDKDGLAAGLFADWRYHADGLPKEDFCLNQATYQGANILLAEDNFGCGSSREHAPWALRGWGFKVVIAPSFADIFRNNALKNGLLPVALPAEQVEDLFELAAADPAAQLMVDLEKQTVTREDAKTYSFSVDPFARRCLLAGTDVLGYLLSHTASIEAYENSL
jgi:3-isopropylmalate/(R)-2-methylmalate dehydratase small subunit